MVRRLQSVSRDELSAGLLAVSIADLDVYRRSEKWPSTSIALTLQVEGLTDPVSTLALATTLDTLDDLIPVVQPGMGKTTTLFHIAEAVLSNDRASPIIIQPGEQSVDTLSPLASTQSHLCVGKHDVAFIWPLHCAGRTVKNC
ncbi:hypothetical protein PQR66_38020 [Paraburkholderia agricolaris]|uniref:Uncharacterized protein n=1 Tax=Paraburkholderia agricolaris TaxID=2152888 RepID=A0ABW9A3E7_9BURK